MNFMTQLEALDRTTLTPLVHRATKSSTTDVVDWSIHRIHAGGGQGLGVYRVVGSGQDQGSQVPWSLILKAFAVPANGSRVSDWNYWKREVDAYRSGWLSDLPGGIVAPQCFGVDEHPTGSIWLWLEDITDERDMHWSLAHYALTARHFGQFNGSYLVERSLPSDSWVSTGWLRKWVEQATPTMTLLANSLDHPFVQPVFPSTTAAALLRLWAERHTLLDALDRLPQTFCHLDAFRRNLFLRRSSVGREQTVAIDWAFAGRGAIGEEVSPLVVASMVFFEVTDAAADDLEGIVLHNYLEGLRDAGWHGDPRVVQFGYTAASALRYGVGSLRLVLPILLDEHLHPRVEQLLAHPMNEIIEKWAEHGRRMVRLAGQAQQLLQTLS